MIALLSVGAWCAGGVAGGLLLLYIGLVILFWAVDSADDTGA